MRIVPVESMSVVLRLNYDGVVDRRYVRECVGKMLDMAKGGEAE